MMVNIISFLLVLVVHKMEVDLEPTTDEKANNDTRIVIKDFLLPNEIVMVCGRTYYQFFYEII